MRVKTPSNDIMIKEKRRDLKQSFDNTPKRSTDNTQPK